MTLLVCLLASHTGAWMLSRLTAQVVRAVESAACDHVLSRGITGVTAVAALNPADPLNHRNTSMQAKRAWQTQAVTNDKYKGQHQLHNIHSLPQQHTKKLDMDKPFVHPPVGESRRSRMVLSWALRGNTVMMLFVLSPSYGTAAENRNIDKCCEHL